MRPLSTTLLLCVAIILVLVAPATAAVAIAYLNLEGETVTILNLGMTSVDMTGWTLTNEGTKHTYTFPSFTLAGGAPVTVHTGYGTNTASDLYWNRDPTHAAFWNNDGDTATLWDRSGTRIADSNGYVRSDPATPVTTPYPILSPILTPYITTPPTGIASDNPIASPYPTTIQTLPAVTRVTTSPPTIGPVVLLTLIGIPTATTLPLISPAVSPASATGTSKIIPPGVESVPRGKRYAIGTPGFFLGGRFGAGNLTAGSGGTRTVSAIGTVLKPGSVSFGITPPKVQFLRWYPAARWATG